MLTLHPPIHHHSFTRASPFKTIHPSIHSLTHSLNPFIHSILTDAWIFHVIGVRLLSQSAPENHNQEKKPTNLCASREFLKTMSRLIIIIKCYFDYWVNKPFTCSRCMICVSCSVHVISTYYMRKGSWAFLFVLVTHKSTRSELHPVHNLVPRALRVSPGDEVVRSHGYIDNYHPCLHVGLKFV